MYEYGYGVVQDYAEAVRWFRLAAEQGHAKAQYNLGHQKFFRSTYALVQSPEST
jgi:TPR repeat protein